MTRFRRGFALAILIAAAILVFVNRASVAQDDYPNQTIRFIVPLPPGPVADAVPRLVAQKLAIKFGQPAIIENRPGAAQNIGAEVVAKANPDGYTLLATPPAPLVVSQYFYPTLAFDPTAFVPVTVMVTIPAAVVINPKLPVSNFQEFLAYAKANPEKVTYGSPGAGSTPQLAMEQLAAAAGIRLVHVPYQGLAPAMNDLLAGNIDMMIDNVGNVMQHVKDGSLKIIAVTGTTRHPEFPGVPAVSEFLPGVSHEDWDAVVAPPKTPSAIAVRLSQAIAEVLKMPDVVARLHEFYLNPVGSSPEEAAALFKRESERWRKVIASKNDAH
jgi:tripartite-type tricarboxylate transporter receptor subunit TctC